MTKEKQEKAKLCQPKGCMHEGQALPHTCVRLTGLSAAAAAAGAAGGLEGESRTVAACPPAAGAGAPTTLSPPLLLSPCLLCTPPTSVAARDSKAAALVAPPTASVWCAPLYGAGPATGAVAIRAGGKAITPLAAMLAPPSPIPAAGLRALPPVCAPLVVSRANALL
eukprot:1160573-Pelagomonas_calceolata.AAC.17